MHACSISCFSGQKKKEAKMARDGGMSELTSPAATVEESGTPQASDDDAE
jgi:hypothetical protein